MLIYVDRKSKKHKDFYSYQETKNDVMETFFNSRRIKTLFLSEMCFIVAINSL